ncbi:MAG: thrombospondin type 3 repeat-containing protein [Ghiorsea sp.]
MMLKKLITAAVLMGSIAFSTSASANTGTQGLAQTHYGVTTMDCAVCHNDNNGSGGALNSTFGQAYKNAGATGSTAPTSWTTLDAADSDGDGVNNAQEFTDGTDPARVAGTTVAAAETASVVGCMTSSATLPWMMLLGLFAAIRLIGRKK